MRLHPRHVVRPKCYSNNPYLLFNHKKTYSLQPAIHFNRKATFSSLEEAEPIITAIYETQKPKWKPWSDFRPTQNRQDIFSGNYQGEATGQVYCNFANYGTAKPKCKLSHAQQKATATTYLGTGYGAKQVPPKLSAAQLRVATIAGKIPTIVLNSGDLSSCVKPPQEEMQVSECGEYEWDDPLTATGELSDKTFTMALGHTAKAGEVMEYNVILLQTEATRAHIIPGLQTNLGSVNQMVLQWYI